jgi:hypothetical protein
MSSTKKITQESLQQVANDFIIQYLKVAHDILTEEIEMTDDFKLLTVSATVAVKSMTNCIADKAIGIKSQYKCIN